ncbi:MAG: hypothetical protein PHF84_07490 [bacterium]|nr:hypothetical protein [bacterium]
MRKRNPNLFRLVVCSCLMMFLPDKVSFPVLAGETGHRTPRAGEAYQAIVAGIEIEMEADERMESKGIDVGFTWGKLDRSSSLAPYAGFFWDKKTAENKRRFYLILAGIYNFLDFGDSTWNRNGFEYLITWENSTMPLTGEQVLNGREMEGTEIYTGYLQPGIGFGWRHIVHPHHPDNDLKLGLYYEPDYIYFIRAEDTSPAYALASDTFEHRLHFKMRLDAFERNLLEFRHSGWDFGTDLICGCRQRWRDHGFEGQYSGEDTRQYILLKGFSTFCFGIPGLSERHRLLPSLYAAYSPDLLDRYSAAALGHDSNSEDANSLDFPVLYGVTSEEVLANQYFIATLEYRLEVLFFLFLHFRVSGGFLNCQSLQDPARPDSGIQYIRERFRALDAGISSGFLGDSMISFDYGYNWDIKRGEKRGGYALNLDIIKQF